MLTWSSSLLFFIVVLRYAGKQTKARKHGGYLIKKIAWTQLRMNTVTTICLEQPPTQFEELQNASPCQGGTPGMKYFYQLLKGPAKHF